MLDIYLYAVESSNQICISPVNSQLLTPDVLCETELCISSTLTADCTSCSFQTHIQLLQAKC